jgi:hypothetical protein
MGQAGVLMKRKIRFEITINTYWLHPDRIPEHTWEVELPVGGSDAKFEERTITFDEVSDEMPFDTACRELKKAMGNTPYHIWYWTWIQ